MEQLLCTQFSSELGQTLHLGNVLRSDLTAIAFLDICCVIVFLPSWKSVIP